MKVRNDAKPDALVGRLDNMVSGQQREFASAQELVEAIVSDLQGNTSAQSVDATRKWWMLRRFICVQTLPNADRSLTPRFP